MTAYKSEYETRLLYSQSYMADEAVNVATDIHAILWSYTGVSPTTTRVRLTYIYTKEVKGISPVQGLIEQWKSEGWVVIDEFCDGYQDFVGIEDFRAHMLEMTRAFLLGVPFGSEVQGSVFPKGPPIKTGLKIPKPGSISSRLDSIIKKSTSGKDDMNNEEDDDIYAKAIKVTRVLSEDKLDDLKPRKVDTSREDTPESDDDDDDDWI